MAFGSLDHVYICSLKLDNGSVYNVMVSEYILCVCMAERDGEGGERKSIPDAFIVYNIQWDVFQHAGLNETRHHLCPNKILWREGHWCDLSSYILHSVHDAIRAKLSSITISRHITALQRQLHGHANWICPNMNLLKRRHINYLDQWPQYLILNLPSGPFLWNSPSPRGHRCSWR